MKLLIPILCALLVSTIAALPDEPEIADITIELQVVTVPQALAIPLVAELQDDIEPAYAKIQEWLAKGTAQLVAWPIITTKSDQKAIFDGTRELRFPVGFESPAVTFSPSLPTDKPVTPAKVDMRAYSFYPTSFETAQLGVSLEVEPAIFYLGEPPDFLSLSLVAKDSRLRGFTQNTVTIENGSKVSVEQPDIETHRVITNITLRPGQRILLGVFRVHEPANHFEFFILKASKKILRQAKIDPKPEAPANPQGGSGIPGL